MRKLGTAGCAPTRTSLAMLPWRPTAGAEPVGVAPPVAQVPQGAQQPPPINLASTLFFLQSEHRRYNRDRNEWEIERAEMRARLALLEGEKRGNEGAIRDLGRRCKMLESALRNERSLSLPPPPVSPYSLRCRIDRNSSPPRPHRITPPRPPAPPLPSKSPTRSRSNTSKVPHPPPPLPSRRRELPPLPSPTEEPFLATTSEAVLSPPSRPVRLRREIREGGRGVEIISSSQSFPFSKNAISLIRAVRDDRCLQEITYLTSPSTLNPLSANSYSAPSLVRPRKILSDYPAPPSAIPLNSTASPMVNSLNPTAQAGLFSLSNATYNSSVNGTTTGTRSTGDASNYPSDPASVFVPLTRQGSTQGARGSSIRAIELEAERPDAAEREREGREAREAREGAGTTTSFMAVKPPPPSPPATPAPPPSQSTPDVPLQLSEPPEEEDDDDEEEEEEGGERTIEANDDSLDVNSIDDDGPPPPAHNETGRRNSQSARGSMAIPDLMDSLRMPRNDDEDVETDGSSISELPSLPPPPPSGLAVDDIDDDDDTPGTAYGNSDSLYSGAFSNSDSSTEGGVMPRRSLHDLRNLTRQLGPGERERDQDALAGIFRSHREELFESMSRSRAEPQEDDDLDPVGGAAEHEDDDEIDEDARESTAEAEGKSGTGLVWENEAGELSEQEKDHVEAVESVD